VFEVKIEEYYKCLVG